MFRPPILNDVSENWSYSVRDDIISKFKVVRILDLAIQNLTNNTQDIDCRDDNRRTSNDSGDTMEGVNILERTHEDGHLSNEAREARKTEVGQTSHNVTHSKERHDLHQTSDRARASAG